jgi:hypothetical protein
MGPRVRDGNLSSILPLPLPFGLARARREGPCLGGNFFSCFHITRVTYCTGLVQLLRQYVCTVQAYVIPST